MRSYRKKRFVKGFKKGILKRTLKRNLVYRWYQFRRREVRAMLGELKYFPEELIDYLLEVNPTSIVEVKKAVDEWLHMEALMTEFKRERYKIGEAHKTFALVGQRRLLWESEIKNL